MFTDFMTHKCRHCGFYHDGVCSRIKSVQYWPDGTVKYVEYWPETWFLGYPPGQEPDNSKSENIRRDGHTTISGVI